LKFNDVLKIVTLIVLISFILSTCNLQCFFFLIQINSFGTIKKPNHSSFLEIQTSFLKKNKTVSVPTGENCCPFLDFDDLQAPRKNIPPKKKENDVHVNIIKKKVEIHEL
jgi:hypothetical protein